MAMVQPSHFGDGTLRPTLDIRCVCQQPRSRFQGYLMSPSSRKFSEGQTNQTPSILSQTWFLILAKQHIPFSIGFLLRGDKTPSMLYPTVVVLAGSDLGVPLRTRFRSRVYAFIITAWKKGRCFTRTYKAQFLPQMWMGGALSLSRIWLYVFISWKECLICLLRFPLNTQCLIIHQVSEGWRDGSERTRVQLPAPA